MLLDCMFCSIPIDEEEGDDKIAINDRYAHFTCAEEYLEINKPENAELKIIIKGE